jgi:hypothetical protein
MTAPSSATTLDRWSGDCLIAGRVAGVHDHAMPGVAG